MKVVGRSGIVYKIEDVVDFNPKLSSNVLGDSDVLKHREVDLVSRRAIKLVKLLIRVGAWSGRRECRRIEPVIGTGGSICGGHIREEENKVFNCQPPRRFWCLLG